MKAEANIASALGTAAAVILAVARRSQATRQRTAMMLFLGASLLGCRDLLGIHEMWDDSSLEGGTDALGSAESSLVDGDARTAPDVTTETSEAPDASLDHSSALAEAMTPGDGGIEANEVGQAEAMTPGDGGIEASEVGQDAAACPRSNACGGCGALSAAPGSACGKCGSYVCSADKRSISCSDPGMNGCGGCGALSGAPNGACGCNGKFMFVCSADKSSVTCNDPGANKCGGCGVLSAVPGSTCGSCGAYVCSADKTSVTCSDPGLNVCGGCGAPVLNACGGCGTLAAAPGSSCGNCGSYACTSDKKSVTCSDPGLNMCGGCGAPVLNACGGCGTLAAAPGSSCGNCGSYACTSDKKSVMCMNQGCAPTATQACDTRGTQTCSANCAWGRCVQPSCQGGGVGAGLNCGASGASDCCASFAVPGGPFYRGSDTLSPTMMYPAAISKFRLDAFLVTVGRFRSFVNAWDGGWRPAAGSGKHTHLNNGAGLVLQGSAPPTYEGGWDPSNAQFLTTTAADWNSILTMNGYVHGSTWTMNPTSNDNLPITGLDWWEAYAFCIWDGGFLPSDSEILYTAAGGGDSLGQRIYPWSSPPSNATVDCTYANYGGPDPACTNPAAVRPVGALPNGNGRWGHSDLAGNAWQWTLDSNNGFGGQCTDCYYPCFGGGGANCGAHYVRGGAFTSTSTADMQPARGQAVAGTEARSANSGATQDLGVRCARIP